MQNSFEIWWAQQNDIASTFYHVAKTAWEAAASIERERCAKIAEGVEKPEHRHWVPGSLYDTLRKETAAEIRQA